jgi:Fe2+ or Zn2+ uptake regulation protein
MRDVDELTTLMRRRGMRVTPQRQAVVRRLVDNTTHPTVDALYEAVRAELPAVSRRTVYQTVHDLEALGEVRLLDLGTGSVRVDPNVEHAHHHLVCTRCGAVRDIPAETSGPATLTPLRHQGFTVEAVEINFRGFCDDCDR